MNRMHQSFKNIPAQLKGVDGDFSLVSAVMSSLLLLFLTLTASAQQLYVAKTGSDANPGTESLPFLTISKAAKLATPGKEIIIHEGTYREYINPPTGGTSNANRITFKSAEGEEVFVKGSEVIDTWENNGDNTWQVTLPNEFFGAYNPYSLRVDGDFQNYGQWHHRGDVYINNGVLNELQTVDQVMDEAYTWYTSTTNEGTTIVANFAEEDPNTELTEINVRELIFFTTALNIDYITIDGLRFLHAAPNWQAPNVGSSDPNPLTQKGAVGSKMGKGWIIENCEVSYSKTAGIMMGESFDDFSSFENINAFGDHLIRNNVITKCGEYGIAGQKGLTRSTIIGNRIEDINFRNEFGGYEPAGIKIWNCVDVHIENNLIRRITATQNDESQSYCIWIDYANQGTRITRNFLIGSDMTTTTLFLEANIGPTLVDNNIIVETNNKKIFVFSGGSIFANNLFVNTGFLFQIQTFDNGGSGGRNAYTFNKHTLVQTNVGQSVEIEYNQLYNNIFAKGAGPIDFGIQSGTGNVVDHNLYIGGTSVGSTHANATLSSFDFTHRVTDTDTGIDFSFDIDNSFDQVAGPYLNQELVGTIPFPNQSIADEFGNPITVNIDFNEESRLGTTPKVGPLESLMAGTNTVSIGAAIEPAPSLIYEVPVSIPRTEETVEQAPFKEIPLSIPGVIEAEEFDFGGPNVSYFDDDKKDGFTGIRPNENVDIGGGANDGLAISWFANEEWLEYTVDIEAGVYTIEVEAASAELAPGDLVFSINDQQIATVDISGTQGWKNYETFNLSDIPIGNRSLQQLRITSTGGFNLDRISFIKTAILSTEEWPDYDILSVYPNPVEDTLNVVMKTGETPEVEIHTLEGKRLLHAQSELLDLSSLSNGVYLLVVNKKEIKRISKISIK